MTRSIFLADEEHQIAWHGFRLANLMESPFLRIRHKLVAVAGTMLVIVQRCGSIDTWHRFPRSLCEIFTRTLWQVNTVAQIIVCTFASQGSLGILPLW